MTFLLVSSTDHIAAVTGVAPTVTISKNGAAFGAPAGAVSEIGNGWYALSGNATDRNTLGGLLIHATATGADPVDDRYTVVPWDPFDGAALGLTRIDAAVTSRLATAGYTAPDNASVTAIKGKTDNLPASPAAVSDIPTATQNADALLKRDWTSVTGEAARSVLNALRALRNKVSISSATVTVTKEDDSTAAWTGAVTTDAAAQPITGIDPS